MRRALLLLVFAVSGIACDRLHALSEADLQIPPGLESTYLRYHVSSPRGEWSREFAVSARDFAELRETGDRPYVLGLEDTVAWLRVGARAPVEIDGALAADERREAAWIGMRFGEGKHTGHLELEQCHGTTCTLVYTPRDGHALWVDVDRKTRRPSSFEWVAQDHAIESCEHVEWSDVDGAAAIASATCSAIVDQVGRETTRWTLEERRSDAAPPEWARVRREDMIPLRPPREVVEVAVADPSQRIYVPVEAGGSQPLRLVLDTGSPVTVLTRRVVDELGVAPSPEPPVHVRPPWLPEDTYDPEIVDRLVIAGIELHGVPVLVPRNDAPFAGEEAGLLGMDLLARYIVDVDGPASKLRFWTRGRFVSGAAFTDLSYRGSSHGSVVVDGAIDELGPMPVMVDTGAPLNVVVGGPEMHVRHPRQRGEEMRLSEDDSYDYTSEVEGFHLGPFGFPRMPAVGRDRRPDLPFLDSGGALVGLGVLRHFRIAVDSKRGVLRVAPGPSYTVLTRLGFEVDERNGAPTVTRIVYGEHDWNKPLRVGDVVLEVDGRKVKDRTDALARIAAAKGQVRVTVDRHGNVVSRTLVMGPAA